MKRIIISFLLICVTINLSAQNQGWNFINPVSEGKDLISLSFYNENEGYAVGLNGTILHSNNGGNNWEKLESPTEHNLYGVSYYSSTDAIAVGDNGIILRKSFGSSNWNVQSVSVYPKLNDIEFVDQNIGFIAGDVGSVLRSTDGGNNWVTLNSNIFSNLNSINIIDANTIFAVGDNGTIIKSTDAGTNWVVQTSPINQQLLDVDFATPFSGAIVGYNGTMLNTTDGGSTWNLLPQLTFDELSGIEFFNDSTAVALGGPPIFISTDKGATWNAVPDIFFSEPYYGLDVVNSNKAIAVGYRGAIIESIDTGMSWNYLNGGLFGDFKGVCVTDINNITLVGDRGAIYKSTDAGHNWLKQAWAQPDLLDVDFCNSENGYAVGYEARILHTSDGGSNWNLVFTNGLYLWLEDVSSPSVNFATAVGQGGRILNTTDSGVNWTLHQSPTTNNLYGVDFINSQVGFAVGDNGTILHTSDGGLNWELQNSNFPNSTLFEVSFIDENNGVAVGGDWFSIYSLILKTTDGGENWTQINQNTAQNYLYDVQFISANVLTAINEGIFRSTDAGLTWTLQENGVEGATLISLSFIDEMNGVIVGDDGIILRTTNGGVTFIQEEQTEKIPAQFLLSQNYPNPFNPSTKIKYEIPLGFAASTFSKGGDEGGFVTLKVYDVLGNEIATLVNEVKSPGTYEVVFNPASIIKYPSSGIYFYQLKAGNFLETKKMVLAK